MEPMELLQVQVQGLEPMTAIRWTSSALARTGAAAQSPSVARAIRFADRWLADPDEGGRLAALEQAEKLGYQGTAGLMFASIAWTGNSMVDPRVAVVEPPAGLASKSAGAAVLTALMDEAPEDREVLVRTFIEETAALGSST